MGNADPNALCVAVAAAQAVHQIGMPEARIILSQAVTYVASAPKSNAAYLAVDKALEAVKNVDHSGGNQAFDIPVHLKDAHYKGAAKLGHGLGYQYAHDFPNHYVNQQYLPYELNGKEFYRPSGNGYEVKIKEHMRKIRREAGQPERRADRPES